MPAGKPPLLLDMPDEVVGERVVARCYRPGDAPAVWEAVEESRSHLQPWLPWVGSYRSPADAEVFVRRAYAQWLLREDFVVGIWRRDSGDYLGGSGLHPRDWTIPWFEIGYWLRPSAEGHGYMTEAVRLLCDLAFGCLEAQRVHIQCDARNERSAAVARRLGFVHEGTLRSHSRSPDGQLRDTLVFSRIADRGLRNSD